MRTSVLVCVATCSVVALGAFFIDGVPVPAVAIASGLVSGIASYVVVSRFVIIKLARVTEAIDRVGELGVGTENTIVPNDGDELDALNAKLDRASTSVSERITQLRRIENYRQEFLGDVSHELQTPIFAVEGFAETLLEGALEDPAVNRSFVEKIHRNARRLSALVNDLSDISQIETGSLRMNRVPFDPRQLAEESVEALEMAADQAGIQLFTFFGQGVGQVVGDRERVRQVLLNLLTNGIKYNNPGGSVELALWVSGDYAVTLSVTDDGIGMSEEDIPRVTERFYRVDKSRSRERGGTGLGLAIVKHIVEAHGTSLQIQSKPGHGSTFSFTLPVASIPDPPNHDPTLES